jgi:hypothetical protein
VRLIDLGLHAGKAEKAAAQTAGRVMMDSVFDAWPGQTDGAPSMMS